MTNITELSIFPNPATDFVNVRLTSKQEGRLQITVVDMNGRTVIAPISFAVEANDVRQHTIDLSRLEFGVYFLSVQRDGHNTMERIVISR